MKKLLFWMVLIVGTVVLLGSCAKKEESTTASSGTFTGTTTAAGSITVGSETLSGTYVSPCNSEALIATTASAGNLPSDTVAMRDVLVVTSDTSISEETHGYTDTTCSTLSVYSKNGWDNFTVGDASGEFLKVTYKETGFKIKAGTTVAETYYENYFSTNGITASGTTIDLVVGTEYDVGGSGSSYMNLFYVNSTIARHGEGSTSSYPTAMDSLEMAKQ